jgi:hypothetical protein
VLWGDDFCYWVGVIQELHLEPVVVILANLDSLDLVRATVGEACFVGLATDVEAILGTLAGKCHLGLVDGRHTKQVCSLGDSLGLTCILGTKNICWSLPGWRHNSYGFNHCEVGGVTTSSTQGVCLVRGDQLPLRSALPVVVLRHASTMLSPQAPAHKYRDAPTASVLTPLGCKNLGSW